MLPLTFFFHERKENKVRYFSDVFFFFCMNNNVSFLKLCTEVKCYLAEISLDDLRDVLNHGQEGSNDPQETSPDQQPCPATTTPVTIIVADIPSTTDGGEEDEGDGS